ncbi:MAG: hypothetical protein IJK18_04405 [Clostridia bacterium]|nr:hypothetical protein [Clostridia bacterium]
MSSVFFQDGENYRIDRSKKIKITRYDVSGDAEIIDTSNKVNGLKDIEKISKNMYFDKKKNRYVRYKSDDEKTEDSLRKSMKVLNNKLKNNFNGGSNELFITLTTTVPVTDVAEIKLYFEQFWEKLKSIYNGLEYAYVLEWQEQRNSWHFHLLLKDIKNPVLYIPNSKIELLWGKGYTKTSRVSADLKYNSIDEEEILKYDDRDIRNTVQILGIKRVISYMCKMKSKKSIPRYVRCFETSRNLKSPQIEVKTYGDIYDEMIENNYQLSKERTTLVRDVKTKAIVNKIKKEVWSIK